VAVGDFNGDGIPDLAVANFNGKSVSVLLGNGDGSFQAPRAYATGNGPVSLAVADFNGDGVPDLVVAGAGADGVYGNTVSVLLGNGDGSFQAKTDFVVGSEPRSVAVGDFNGDGIADLAVANYGGKSVSVLLGNGDGTFQAKVDYPIEGSDKSGPFAVAVADVNGDGVPDLVVANAHYLANGTVSVLCGKGDGTFLPAIYFGAGKDPFAVAVGDLTGTGHSDIVTANYDGNCISVLRGDGNGSFQSAVEYPAGSAPYSVAIGDFNGDGIPDIVVPNPYPTNGTVSVLLGNGDGSFRTPVKYTVGSRPVAVAAADLTGDGLLDLVAANYSSNNVSVLLNDGNWPSIPLNTSSPTNQLARPEIVRALSTGVLPIAAVATTPGATLPDAISRPRERSESELPEEQAIDRLFTTDHTEHHPMVVRLGRLDSIRQAAVGEDPLRENFS
jgi:hypothetical protein